MHNFKVGAPEAFDSQSLEIKIEDSFPSFGG